MHIKALVRYKTRKNSTTTTHQFYYSKSGAYAGVTESAIMYELKQKHSDSEIIINSIDWKI